MFGGKGHVDDSALVRRYLADRGLEALEPKDEAVVRHLGRCGACSSRYAALRAGLDETRDAVFAEVDAVCSPERLERQRERILRHVDDGRSGATRVVVFPAPPHRAKPAHEHRVLARWVAAAAVVGLMVGLTAGRLFDVGSGGPLPGARRQAAIEQAHARGELVIRPAVSGLDSEDQFLSELELATSVSAVAELRAIYAFTLEEPSDAPRPGKD